MPIDPARLICHWDGCDEPLPNLHFRYCPDHRDDAQRARWRADYLRRDKTRMASLRSASRARARDRREGRGS